MEEKYEDWSAIHDLGGDAGGYNHHLCGNVTFSGTDLAVISQW